jgi:hypothetical protein
VDCSAVRNRRSQHVQAVRGVEEQQAKAKHVDCYVACWGKQSRISSPWVADTCYQCWTLVTRPPWMQTGGKGARVRQQQQQVLAVGMACLQQFSAAAVPPPPHEKGLLQVG